MILEIQAYRNQRGLVGTHWKPLRLAAQDGLVDVEHEPTSSRARPAKATDEQKYAGCVELCAEPYRHSFQLELPNV